MASKRFFPFQILFWSYMILSCGGAHAQTYPSDSYYEKGGRIYSGRLEFVSGFGTEDEIEMYSLRMGCGSFLYKNLTLFGLLDVSGTLGNRLVKTDNEENLLNAESFGLGTSFLLQWYFVRIGPIRLYIDVGGGILYTFQSFPPQGTKLNFTARPGGGLAILLSENIQLLAGATRFHLSNGQGYKHPQNPAVDGFGVYVGVLFRAK